MPSLGRIIILFTTILQITLASSIIPPHSKSINPNGSEFLGAPGRNLSSSTKKKRSSLLNILSKRADEKLGQMCGDKWYGDKKRQDQVEKFCEKQKKFADKLHRGPPKLPVYVGKDKSENDVEFTS
ncbi:hypothetical protein GcM1_183007 [Golovinomyces cichoracearum]|uniref:Secreted effector protein n=1 Tax=Golovinomyces cichoracearum TaxID=62708 RepID=A0A420J3J0_9PEZI|nr:hypothetical protein GcM1_183007 [Golovinomyces cichoracearum]